MDERDTVRQFTEEAARFCSLIDGAHALGPQAFVEECASCLAAVYHYGIHLPDVTPFSERVADSAVSPEQARAIRRMVRTKLGRHDLYWQVFDPYDEESPVASMLSDDIAEVYRDLKTGLVAFQSGSSEARNDAIWDWRFGFLNHWGRHLVSALAAVHALMSGQVLEDL